MTSRMPIAEIIANMMITNGAAMEFFILNGREPTEDELEEFRPKYIEAAKAGAFNTQEPACPTCGHIREDEDE